MARKKNLIFVRAFEKCVFFLFVDLMTKMRKFDNKMLVSIFCFVQYLNIFFCNIKMVGIFLMDVFCVELVKLYLEARILNEQTIKLRNKFKMASSSRSGLMCVFCCCSK